MKYTALFLLLLAPAYAQLTKPIASVTAAPASGGVPGTKSFKITRGSFTELEKRMDGMLLAVGSINEPLSLLGSTRGVYLEGYGLVFTSELSLVMTSGISPFQKTISKEAVAQVHQRKVERLPQLQKTMREMLRQAALALTQVPESQYVTLVVRLDYLPWENTSGLPGQMILRSDRHTAMSGEEIKMEEN